MNSEINEIIVNPTKIVEQEMRQAELYASERIDSEQLETDTQRESVHFEFAVNGLETVDFLEAPIIEAAKEGTVVSHSGTCQAIQLALNPNPFNSPAVIQLIKTMYGHPVEQQVTLG